MATMPSQINRLYEFGSFRLDSHKRLLLKGNEPVSLTPKVIETLIVLVENRSRVVSKDELMKTLWPDSFVEESNLSQNIFVLRKALGDSHEKRFILTVSGKGYQFVASVEEITPTPATPPPFTPDSLIGKKVSHYRIVQVLGCGGMGVVYKAEDLKLGRRAALKFLPNELASDPKALDRIEREARAASSLDHPNICAIYELGEHEAQPFIVMQLLEGETLREWIGSGPVIISDKRIEEILSLAIQITKGLEAAHQKGIIHRDIKPSNIFITNRGEAKILDFGVAKIFHTDVPDSGVAESSATIGTHADLSLTQTGDSVGTPSYLSPEQIRGEKLDARTDLFSFGLVLYEMATGKQTYSGKTAADIRDAVLNLPPVPACQLNPDLPPELERIIEKSLEKDLDRRYQSASDLRADLLELSKQPQAVSRRRVRGAVWISAALIAAALVILAINFSTIGARLTRNAISTESVEPVKLRPSVAVIGFKNLSGNNDKNWVATALSEMVAAEIASGQQLRVVSSEDVERMKLDLSLPVAESYGQNTLKKIRTHLNSDIVVLGSYLDMGGDAAGKIRIDLEMQDARTGETIAVISREGSESNLGDLVSQGGTDLRQRLGIAEVSPGDTPQVRAAVPANLQAARLYAEGLASLRKFDALAARDLLQKAIAADPRHALSHWALAQAWYALGYDAKAEEEAKKAFDLSGQLSRETRLTIEARYRNFSHNYPAAIEIYRTLYNFFPDNSGYGFSLAEAQLEGGANKDSLATIQRIRSSFPSLASDPRLDFAESHIQQNLSDFRQEQQLAASAATKARAQGATLMVASSRLEESWAWDHLGKPEESMAALTEARELAQGRNPHIEALADLLMGHVFYDKGDLEAARKSYDQALEGYRKIGEQHGLARCTEAIGNVLLEQQKLEEAKWYYEEEIRINREVGRVQGVTSGLIGLGNLLEEMGDLPGAARADEQALRGFQQLGNKGGAATATSNWGIVLIEQGRLQEAKTKIEQAMVVQREIGYKRGLAFSLSSLAEILRLEDHLEQANKTAEQASTIRKEIGDEGNTSRSQAQLAQIMLERGRDADAESLARSAAAASNKLNKPDVEAMSYAILAEVLSQQGKAKDAQDAAMHAVALSQKLDRTARFESAIAVARAETGARKLANAAPLEAAHAEASRYGYAIYEMMTRLELARLDLKSEKPSMGEALLQQLQKDAQAKGCLLIVRKARSALRGQTGQHQMGKAS